jgi:hypothetical protein
MNYKNLIPTLILSTIAQGCIVDPTPIADNNNSEIDQPSTISEPSTTNPNQICEPVEHNQITFNIIAKQIFESNQLNTNNPNTTCLLGTYESASNENIEIWTEPNGDFNFEINMRGPVTIESQIICEQADLQETHNSNFTLENVQLFPISNGRQISHSNGTQATIYSKLSSINLGLITVNATCESIERLPEADTCHGGPVIITRNDIENESFWCITVNNFEE